MYRISLIKSRGIYFTYKPFHPTLVHVFYTGLYGIIWESGLYYKQTFTQGSTVRKYDNISITHLALVRGYVREPNFLCSCTMLDTREGLGLKVKLIVCVCVCVLYCLEVLLVKVNCDNKNQSLTSINQPEM